MPPSSAICLRIGRKGDQRGGGVEEGGGGERDGGGGEGGRERETETGASTEKFIYGVDTDTQTDTLLYIITHVRNELGF